MTKFAVKNPVTVMVLALILIAAGLTAYRGMPRESFPEIKIPLIFVTVLYPGASPEDMEKLVSEKIEDKLEGLDGLKKVTSTSGDGYSSVQVEFNPDVAVETALRRVKDKVDEAKPDFPQDAKEPVIQELNFSNVPIFVISLSSTYENERLEQIAQDLKDRISNVPGVLKASLTGKQQKEIAIDADPAKLQAIRLGAQRSGQGRPKPRQEHSRRHHARRWQPLLGAAHRRSRLARGVRRSDRARPGQTPWCASATWPRFPFNTIGIAPPCSASTARTRWPFP